MVDDKQKNVKPGVRRSLGGSLKRAILAGLRIFEGRSKREEKKDLGDRISKHISLKEATKSRTAVKKGIDNTPDETQLKAMREVAENVFEPLREYHGSPIGISSFLRVSKLNQAVGGSKISQHVRGEAIDIDADIYNNGITNADIFNFIRENLIFDQLIWEFGDEDEPNWVHVSYTTRRTNRRKIIIAYRDSHNKVRYKNWDRD